MKKDAVEWYSSYPWELFKALVCCLKGKIAVHVFNVPANSTE